VNGGILLQWILVVAKPEFQMSADAIQKLFADCCAAVIAPSENQTARVVGSKSALKLK